VAPPNVSRRPCGFASRNFNRSEVYTIIRMVNIINVQPLLKQRGVDKSLPPRSLIRQVMQLDGQGVQRVEGFRNVPIQRIGGVDADLGGPSALWICSDYMHWRTQRRVLRSFNSARSGIGETEAVRPGLQSRPHRAV
jgi:hypothetical protein